MIKKGIYVLIIYKILRHLVSYTTDKTSGFIWWFIGDTFITVFRIIAFLLIYELLRREGVTSFKKEITQKALKPFLAWAILDFGLNLACVLPYGIRPLETGYFIIMLGSNLAVGFFEEFTFRGLFLKYFKDKYHYTLAILYSSLLFTLSHIGVQPLKNFPMIFLFGMTTSYLRIYGCSLIWLSLYHAIYDHLYYGFSSDFYGTDVHFFYLFLISLFGFSLVYFWPKIIKKLPFLKYHQS